MLQYRKIYLAPKTQHECGSTLNKMSHLKIYILGGLQFKRADSPITDFISNKVPALLRAEPIRATNSQLSSGARCLTPMQKIICAKR